MVEWFREELDCTLFHRLSPYLGVVIRRNKDDGNVASLLFQPGLQLQTRHLRHADVNDQARGPAMRIGFEERFCWSEAFCLKPPDSIRSLSESCIDSLSSMMAINLDVWSPRPEGNGPSQLG
jgi:hypothetical protein